MAVYAANGLGDAIRTIPCLILIAYGLTMSNVDVNEQIGIRLPWVMSSDWTWQMTHKFTGPVCIVFGAGWLITNLFYSTPTFYSFGTYVGIGALAACIIISLVFYWIDPTHKTNHTE